MVSSHEEWREIEEVRGVYSVSSQGRVRNNRTGLILSPVKMPKGYTKVNLKVDGTSKSKQVHRLVAIAFISNPENKPEVNHKNGVKDDNRIENLEWVTGEENIKHAYETGLVRHKDARYSGYLYSFWMKNHNDNMCDEWQNYLAFYKWCHNNGYIEGKYVTKCHRDKKYDLQTTEFSETIDRKPRRYMCFGEELSLDEISEKYSIYKSTLDYRLKHGMSIEEAVMCKKGKANDNCIKIRLSSEMYEYLCDVSHKEGYTVSAYIRGLIDKDMNNTPEMERHQ